MMEIEINNLTKQGIDEKFLKGLAKKVLKGENKKEDISIVFVSKNKIRELNKKYRKEDKITDVLSFGDGLNEVVICPAVIKTKKEIAKVLVHGILHVLGYEHGKEMTGKQEYYSKLLNC